MSLVSGRRLSVVLLDLAVVAGSLALAFLLRFDFQLDAPDMARLLPSIPKVLAPYFVCFHVFSLYRGIYYYSSFSDMLNIAKAVALGAVLTTASILFIHQGEFPRSVLLLHPILTFLGVGGVRFGIRPKDISQHARAYMEKEKHALVRGWEVFCVR